MTLADLGGWLPLLIVALLLSSYVIARQVEIRLDRWLKKKDKQRWKRENGYDYDL